MLSPAKRAFRRLSLVQKFSAAVVILIFAIGFIFNTLIISHQRRALRAEMEGNHVEMVRNLAKDSVGYLIVLDPLRLDELVRTISHAPGAQAVGVLDRGGRIVAHTERSRLGQQGRTGMAEERVDRSSGNILKEISVPVKAGTEVVGLAFASFSRESTEEAIEADLRKLKQYILLISLGIGLAGIWGSVLLARLLTTPLKKVKEQMSLVQAGNLDVTLPLEQCPTCIEVLGCADSSCPAFGKTRCWAVPGTKCAGMLQATVPEKICECRQCPVYREACGDEIGEVVEVFNEMVARLKASIRELEETTQEKARLEKLSALGEMSMTVAHEIKNPLNAIRGATTYLKENFEGEVLKEFLSIIDEETRRLNEIVTSILRYAKPVPIRPQTTDINRIIRETAELVRQEATDANVELTLSLDRAVPSFSLDPQQLKQALLNILVNALDATKAGDSIAISTELLDSRVRVVIKDTGQGMREDIIADIFKPFFSTKTRGSGLGLACVERIVKDHKGSIGVRSAPDRGTEFQIDLPLWS